jgi:hypothetical protein
MFWSFCTIIRFCIQKITMRTQAQSAYTFLRETQSLLRGSRCVFNYDPRLIYSSRSCLGFSFQRVRFHPRGQSMWNLWWNSRVLWSPLLLSFNQCSTLSHIYTLLLPEGQTGEAWKPSPWITGYKIRTFKFVSLQMVTMTSDHQKHRLAFRHCYPTCLLAQQHDS